MTVCRFAHTDPKTGETCKHDLDTLRKIKGFHELPVKYRCELLCIAHFHKEKYNVHLNGKALELMRWGRANM